VPNTTKAGSGGGGGRVFQYSKQEEEKFQRGKLQRQMLPMIAEIVADLSARVGALEEAQKPKRRGVLKGRGDPLAASDPMPEGVDLKERGEALQGVLRQYRALGPASGRARADLAHTTPEPESKAEAEQRAMALLKERHRGLR
jgi:hypothetical protein